ncbi:hypothetical protein IL306_005344, partial [Fusarium sp. DS 682]
FDKRISGIKFIVQTCENYRAADAEVAERIAIVDNVWIRTHTQFKFIELLDPVLDPVLDAEHCHVLKNIIQILATKLFSAARKLESVLLPKQENGAGGELRQGWFRFYKVVRRGKYAFIKDSLDEIIQDMEEWQRRFDPSWFLIMRIADPIIDQKLKQASQGPPASPLPTQRPALSLPPGQQRDQHNQSFTLAYRIQKFSTFAYTTVAGRDSYPAIEGELNTHVDYRNSH